MKKLLYCLPLLWWSCATTPAEEEVPVADTVAAVETVSIEVTHAKGFRVSYAHDCKVVEVINPWMPERVLGRYVLVQRGMEVPEAFRNDIVVEVPLQSIACLSTTHLPLLDQLGLVDRLTGFSHLEFVKNEAVLQRIGAGKITDINGASEIDLEKVLALNPDALMIYPVQGQQYDKYTEAGIKMVYNAEYMEPTPLGKAEWIKFMALFFNEEAKANALFHTIDSAYTYLKMLTDTVAHQPSVIVGNQWKGTWYAPGGQSFVAHFIYDSGADYLWATDSTTGSVQLDFEVVMDQGSEADFWAFVGDVGARAYGKEQVLQEDQRYGLFKAYKENNILFCNTSVTNYFENAVIEPHIVLADMVKHFHPHLLPEHTPVYFKRLN